MWLKRPQLLANQVLPAPRSCARGLRPRGSIGSLSIRSGNRLDASIHTSEGVGTNVGCARWHHDAARLDIADTGTPARVGCVRGNSYVLQVHVENASSI